MERLIITDLDGTFVQNSINVEKLDLKRFKEFAKNNLIAVATGRSVKEIEYIEKENDILFDYKIGFNGAQIIDKNGNEIFNELIDTVNLKKLYDYFKEKKLVFDALDGKKRIGNFIHDKPESLWDMEMICTEYPFDLLENRDIYKINVRPDRNKEVEIFNDLMQKFGDSLSIVKTSRTRIEICAKDISKGNAIKKIMEKTPYYTIGIGDSENDRAMFNVVDYSICMSHSPDELKEIANLVVDKISMIDKI
ncbi:HAD-IIB family hydrolase [Oceanivirga salmonicida]|uniref:HAD-IIB family hydrolase n=1 Tax=Oceanivirga salmonicida TaxID=1769291 RepID=UPI0012E1EBA3|nr:HAD-IIB family hydrolase [Oceanivirga salmonicida]